MRALRHLAAIVLLPGTVTVLVPALLLADAGLASWPLAALGAALLLVGVGLIGWTVALFAGIGRGTLAPWDPTSRLVVRGPYRHVRNPMISGVLAVLLGEAALFGSVAVLIWAAVVFAVNAVYFVAVEEPGLRRRFGAEYGAYAARVPRWLPRPRQRQRPPRAARPPGAGGESD
jgi:protein-S-isoprenylcysteine O-methyltransferase Ste14